MVISTMVVERTTQKAHDAAIIINPEWISVAPARMDRKNKTLVNDQYHPRLEWPVFLLPVSKSRRSRMKTQSYKQSTWATQRGLRSMPIALGRRWWGWNKWVQTEGNSKRFARTREKTITGSGNRKKIGWCCPAQNPDETPWNTRSPIIQGNR